MNTPIITQGSKKVIIFSRNKISIAHLKLGNFYFSDVYNKKHFGKNFEIIIATQKQNISNYPKYCEILTLEF
jgi:hypothetical protein